MSDTTRRGFFGTLSALAAGAVAVVHAKPSVPSMPTDRGLVAITESGIMTSRDGVKWMYIDPAAKHIANEIDRSAARWVSVITR